MLHAEREVGGVGVRQQAYARRATLRRRVILEFAVEPLQLTLHRYCYVRRQRLRRRLTGQQLNRQIEQRVLIGVDRDLLGVNVGAIERQREAAATEDVHERQVSRRHLFGRDVEPRAELVEAEQPAAIEYFVTKERHTAVAA